MAATGAHAQPAGESLAPFRARLDELDEQIARLLGERFDVCRAVAAHKSEHDIPMMQPRRVAQVRERYLARGAQVGLPADFTESLFELLIGATCKLEDQLIAEAGTSSTSSASDEPDASGASGTSGSPGASSDRDSATVGDGSSRR